MDIESPRYIAGILFSNALMNGAYIGSSTMEDVQVLTHSSSGAVIVGSITEKPRTRNAYDHYWRHKERFFSLSSYGMPNGGIPYFQKQLPKMVSLAHRYGKPLITNVAGFSPTEFVHLVGLSEEAGADMVELNLGCPHSWNDTKEERIISYHASLVESVLDAIKRQHPKITICTKLSPLPPDILREVTATIADSGIVKVITATNSYPNASLATGTSTNDTDSDLLAGMSGKSLKPISIGVIRQIRKVLPKRIAIIGCGGIYNAGDVSDYLEAGAQAIQIASSLIDNGPSTFDKIIYQAANTLITKQV